jgi:hypothetical protein
VFLNSAVFKHVNGISGSVVEEVLMVMVFIIV